MNADYTNLKKLRSKTPVLTTWWYPRRSAAEIFASFALRV